VNRGAAIVAYGAISALGEGAGALGVPAPGEKAPLGITADAELTAAGFARPFAARARIEAQTNDRATVILRLALRACIRELDLVMPDWRSRRVGLALATSAGGMRTAQRFFASLAKGEGPRSPDEAVAATYFGPMVAALVPEAREFEPATLVLTACSASTVALGIGMRWLEQGACDLVLAGGFDAVSTFVASGFEVLRATTGTLPPRPFCAGRDGMALGEGAGIVALVSPERAVSPLAYLRGFGASSDAVHITAPDRSGNGLYRAARAALADAAVEPAEVRLVSAHATATPFNDAAEAQALVSVFGEAGRPVIHPAKAQLGHTLGAAGVLETLGAAQAVSRGVFPAAAVVEGVEPGLSGRVLERAEAGPVDCALKLSAAFGGANAALVVGRSCPLRARALRPVYVSRAVVVEAAPEPSLLAARVQHPLDKLLRADLLVRLALTAIADLIDVRLGSAAALEGAGVVIGHAFATVETNFTYDARLRDRGPRTAEPRRFPYTSPNAVAGECGIVFHLPGPGVAVGSGPHGGLEALSVAVDLVRAGDAERMVVVAVDEVGEAVTAMAQDAQLPVPRSGAVALLVTAEPTSYARVESATVALGARAGPFGPPGHLALRPLAADGACPSEIASVSPWGHAKLTLTSPER
jgi:3-oxoacyl-[acyl-carrier-protein] synthase II